MYAPEKPESTCPLKPVSVVIKETVGGPNSEKIVAHTKAGGKLLILLGLCEGDDFDSTTVMPRSRRDMVKFVAPWPGSFRKNVLKMADTGANVLVVDMRPKPIAYLHTSMRFVSVASILRGFASSTAQA